MTLFQRLRHGKALMAVFRTENRMHAALTVIAAAAILVMAWLWMIRPIDVFVDLNGEQYEIQTQANTVQELFAELDVDVSAEDGVYPDLDTSLEADMNVTWIEAVSIEAVLDGEHHQLATIAETVADVLDELGIDYDAEHDDIYPTLTTSIEANMKLNWRPAVPVTVQLDETEEQVKTTAHTVGQLLSQLDVEPGSYDDVIPTAETALTSDMHVVWKPAQQYVLNVRGEETEIWSTANTVEELLAEHDIELQEGDELEPSANASLAEGVDHVVITHYEEEIIEEEYSTEVQTVHRNDDSLVRGTERVEQEGQGERGVHRYKITYKNGEEMGRERVETEVIQPAEERIIAVGTQQQTTTASTDSSSSSSGSNESNASSGATETFQATAYTARCNGCSGFTSTGVDVRNQTPNIIAVDPSVIPLGSNVEIIVGGSSWGVYQAADTGGNIQGNKIDILMETRAEARRFGHREVEVRRVD